MAISVLHVEDCDTDALVIKAAVKNPAIEITRFSDVDSVTAEAIEKADIFLLDLFVGSMFGVGIVRHFRELTDSPIVVLTGSEDPVLIDQVKAAGADAVCHKDQVDGIFLHHLGNLAAKKSLDDFKRESREFDRVVERRCGTRKRDA